MDVFTKNKAALGLYKKMGFEKVGVIKGYARYYGEFEDDALMVKYL